VAGRPRIGVLALQGDFAEHAKHLLLVGAEPAEVRLPEDLQGLVGLILPGGESTTMGKLLDRNGLIEPIQQLGQAGFPIWGTCAGMILLGRQVVNGLPDQPLLGLMDLRVVRNAFGRQVDSFCADLKLPILGPKPLAAVFIRAPLAEPLSDAVEVLCRYDGRVVAARQGNLVATSFHPELSPDTRLHAWFLNLATKQTSLKVAQITLAASPSQGADYG
jgi:pyridoxal 5'-phosphate synthase pdxT subunit